MLNSNEIEKMNEQALPSPPNSRHSLENLNQSAELLMKNREYELALRLCGNILQKNAKDLLALRNMGICFYELKQYESSLRCLEQAFVLGKSFTDAILLVESLEALNRFEDAIRVLFDAALLENLSPFENFEIYKFIGNLNLKKGDFLSAEENYNRALRLNPNSDILQVNYGTLEIQRKNHKKAIEFFQRAIELNPKNDRAWTGLALIHSQLADGQLVWGLLKNALEINPFNRTTVQLLANQALQDFDYEFAITTVCNFLEKNPEDLEVNLQWVSLLFQSGNIEAAEFEIQKLGSFYPDSEDIHKMKRMIEEYNVRMERSKNG